MEPSYQGDGLTAPGTDGLTAPGTEQGYLLIGHGTRTQAGQKQFLELFDQFASRLRAFTCAAAFLELAEPSIGQAIEQLVSRGVSRLVTVPVLLFTAGHAESDIPEAVQAAATRTGLRQVIQTPSLGCSEEVLELSARRFRQANCPVRRECQQSCLGDTCGSTALGLIGRGSRSASATAEMLRFTQLRRELTPVDHLACGFIFEGTPPPDDLPQRLDWPLFEPSVASAEAAGAEAGAGRVGSARLQCRDFGSVMPGVDSLLDYLQGLPHQRLVVQPHLLFEGALIHEIREKIAVRQRADRGRHWVLTGTLGVDQSLADTLAALAQRGVSAAGLPAGR